jgi:hypothetical protein
MWTAASALACLALFAAGAPQTPPKPVTQTRPGPVTQAPRDLSSIVRGTVVDAASGAAVADVRVALAEAGRAVRTQDDGRFEFRGLQARTFTLTVSRIGYIFVHRRVEVPADTVVELTIPVAEGTGTYQERVTVTGEAAPSRSPGISSEHAIGSAGLQDLRVVAADDPMRAVQALPGVATGDDFKAQFSVRASSFRHVGFVIDGTATSLLLHAVRGLEDSGSIAMINTDVLSHASLAAGPHPRRHGDWIGATLAFETRDGSRDRAAARLAISGTSASTVLEGPIGSGAHGSWLLSLRKSYLDWLVRKIEPTLDDTLGFSDAQAKVVYDVSDRQQLQLLVITGDAAYNQENATSANQLFRANTQSALLSAGWRYAGERGVLQQRVSFVRNTFDDQGRLGQGLGRGRARGLMWRGDGTWVLSPTLTFEAGLKAEAQRSDQVQRRFQSVAGRLEVRVQREIAVSTTIASAWAQVARTTTAGGVVAGVRVTHDSLDGRTLTSPWLMGERRVGAFTLRAGAGTAAQIPELELRRAIPGFSLRPECASFADAGLEYQITKTIRAQVTGFFRDEWHVLRRVGEDRLVDGERVPEQPFLQLAADLHGHATGGDVVLERRAPSGLTGWIGYTYSRLRHQDTVTGETFDADFDQRHTLNVFVQQRLSYRTTLSAKLRVGSNVPIVGYFDGEVGGLALGATRNAVRLPTYARLDLRANRTFTFNHGRVTLFVELMNALNRDNVSQSNGSIRSSFEAVGFLQRLIPRVPSAGLLIEF